MKKLLITLSIACVIAVIGISIPVFAAGYGESRTITKKCLKTKGHSLGNVRVHTECEITYENGSPVYGEVLSKDYRGNNHHTGKGGRVNYCGCDFGAYSFSDGSSNYHFD